MIELMLILSVLLLASFWTVTTALLLRAAIGLALTSVLLAVMMFKLGAPLAAVFELSVCAGLISVVFVSVITLTHRLPQKEYLARRKDRIKRFVYLPFVLCAAAILLGLAYTPVAIPPAAHPALNDVRVMLWNLRRMDLFGQIAVLLAGVWGVIILFKGEKE